jgi:hypothetical protein
MDIASAARIELRKCLISECSSLACDAARNFWPVIVLGYFPGRPTSCTAQKGSYDASGSRSNASRIELRLADAKCCLTLVHQVIVDQGHVFHLGRAEARGGERREPPPELRAQMEEMAKLPVGETEYFDFSDFFEASKPNAVQRGP